MKQRVLLKGSDAIDLLQRISTLDIKRLQLHQPTSGLILNPQGKIEAAFSIILKEPNEAIIDFSGRFLELLDRYTFSENYEVKPEASLMLDEPTDEMRILGLIPKMGNEFLENGETNPLEINLRNSISDQKGCYPGQEVIEKMISIGSPAKKLCLVKFSQALSLKLPLEVLDSNQNPVGKLTSHSGFYGLAILRKTVCITGGRLTLQHEDTAIEFTIEKVSS